MTKAELIDELRASGRRFTEAATGLGDAQWHFKPAGGGWSLAQTVEHVAVSEVRSGKLVRGRLVREPTPPEVLAAATVTDEWIDRVLGDRNQRVEAPEFVQPTGQWGTPAEALAAFAEGRAATIEFVATTTVDLTGVAAVHPLLGALNGLQWARFLSRHSDRHLDQIREIRASPGFPG